MPYEDNLIQPVPEEEFVEVPQPSAAPAPAAEEIAAEVPSDVETPAAETQPVSVTSEYPLRVNYTDANTGEVYSNVRVEDLLDAGVDAAAVIGALQVAAITVTRKVTYDVIVEHMPEWRQIKWRNYMSIYEKEQAGGTLTTVEEDVIKQMCGTDSPTQDDKDAAYQKCLDALGWINGCVAACDAKEATIKSLTAVEDFKTFTTSDMSFPEWTLGE